MENVINYREMGVRIRSGRLRRALGQAELAGIIGVSQTHMSNIEHGKVGLTLEVLVKLARMFECSLDSIVLGEDAAAQDKRSCLHDYTLGELARALEQLHQQNN